MATMKTVGAYHYAADVNLVAGKGSLGKTGALGGRYLKVDAFTYDFQNFFHPWVGRLIRQLNLDGIEGMLDPKFLGQLNLAFFWSEYTKVPATGGKDRVAVNVHPKTIDLAPGGPYANYNWEMFYHIPVMVAVHLSNNQRFAEAQKWFHLVFDPTATDTTTPTPQRFWKFLTFRGGGAIQDINTLLQILSTPDARLSPADLATKQAVTAGYDAMRQSPFSPHAVARTRPSAYQWYVVMRYLDNLIAWGDNLFLQDTIETLNEATLCYVLAAELLGPRPEVVPAQASPAARNFAQLKAAGLDAMSNALVGLESQFPFNSTPAPGQGGGSGDQSGALFGIGKSQYFCVPPNASLLAYWDVVADRLFKIRNSENIAGVVQSLPLFDPPLDPGMLVQAAAAGIGIGSVVSGLNQPLGPVRSAFLIQKSLELASEVRQLGNALLSSLEKGDTEQLAAMRQDHDVRLQQSIQNVRYLQWQHAQETTNGLLKTRATALERYAFYLRLLGLTPDASAAPATLPLDRRELTEANFADAYAALVGAYNEAVPLQAYSKLALAGSSSPSSQSGATGQGQLYLNTKEDAELNKLLPGASAARTAANVANTIAAGFYPVPSAEMHLAFWGMGVHSKVFSGDIMAAVTKTAAEIAQVIAGVMSDQATIAARTAGYERRADDWTLQANLAARELMQIGRQILASLIAEQVARHDYETVKTQVTQAQEVQSFLQSKFTNAQFYSWMQSDIAGLYYQYYRFAFDTARQAEQTMKRELMRPESWTETLFVQFNYWDTGHKGLLSGEALFLDVKRMEFAYHDNNKRELELTRHVSLRQLNSLALVTLKITGSCTIDLPEWLFDRDCPGHYMRRIKSVAVSIPSVVGPYTSLNGTLALQRSTVRTSPLLTNNQYARNTSNADARFTDYFGGGEAIVTSTGTNDAGLFETNLHDERFLPFEGAGAVSTWTLSLPGELRGFDYLTISDVILHMRYTARPAGDPLASQSIKELKSMLAAAGQSAQSLMFCLRYDFPTEWAAFVNDPTGTANFSLTLQRDDFPYVAQSARTITIDFFALYSPDPQTPAAIMPDAPQPAQILSGKALPFSFAGSVATAQLTLPADTAMVRQASALVYLILQYHVQY